MLNRRGKGHGQTHQTDRRAARAEVIDQVLDAGGGAFRAARLASCVENLQARLVPGGNERAGRAIQAGSANPKIPLSDATRRRRLAERASTSGRKVTPMQIAADGP